MFPCPKDPKMLEFECVYLLANSSSAELFSATFLLHSLLLPATYSPYVSVLLSLPSSYVGSLGLGHQPNLINKSMLICEGGPQEIRMGLTFSKHNTSPLYYRIQLFPQTRTTHIGIRQELTCSLAFFLVHW